MYCDKIRLLRGDAAFHPYTSQNSSDPEPPPQASLVLRILTFGLG